MNPDRKIELRAFLEQALEKAGDRNPFSDDESLFVSGRLDSLNMMMLVMHLEQSCGIDFAEVDFEMALVDSVNEIEAFVDASTIGRAV